MDIESGGESQIQVHFKTKQVQYAISDVPYSIDGNVTTVELNTFINTLLSSSSSSSSLTNDPYVEVEFDFLVFDELLRVRLAEHLREKGISFEDNIEIEYVERFPAPEPQDCLLHDDWVSAVETCDKWILTGCYDNTINLWTIKGKHVLTIPGHTMPIKAVTWISINDDGKAKFISCSQDQTCILWDWTIDSNSVECISVGKGHERGIDCVSVNPNKQRFATGSWDTMLKIWSTDINEITTQVSKRSKPDSGSVKTPQMTLQGHRECISAVQWIDNETLVTGSWDHTLKIWDLNLEGIKAEISTNKSIFDASYSNLNRLIITASADKHLRLYDSRTKYGSVVRNTYFGHQQWVQTVMWSNTEEYLFVSGSYDNTNKLWDCRSPKAPLYDLIGHSDKVMDIDWSNPKYIVSGGADNTIRIYKSRKAFQKQNNTKQKNLVT